MATTYDVFDYQTDELIASGTVEQCAAELGITKSGFRSAIEREQYATNKRIRKYRVVQTGRTEVSRETPSITEQDLLAIQAWDAFCEPLRKEFGIPIRPLRQEDKRNGK